MQVVARFYVRSVTQNADGSASVAMDAVTSKENARWSQYTPAGQITMSLTRKASGARKVFEDVVAAAREGTRKPECVVTFDFAAPPSEQPGRALDAEGKDIGYATDEVLTGA